MITLTPYLGLKKLEYRDTDYPDWGTPENENMDIMDLAFGNQIDTGAISINVVAVAGTFTRVSGSYLTDRFAPGDTILTSGFTNAGNNTTKIINTVTDLIIAVTDNSGLVNETGGGPPYHERIVSIYPTLTFSRYTDENYINNGEAHSLSLDELDIELEKDALLMPTVEQKAALLGEGTPATGNKYATKNYVRVARKRILFPEGVGSVLTPSSGGSNSGNMTTTKEAHGNYVYNYYKWLSTEATFQNYDISIQWRVPETFLSWHATRALIVDICTKENTTTNNKVEVILRKDGIAGSVTSGEVCSTVANDWYSEREIPLASLIFAGTGSPFSTLVAGDILNITIRCSSKENGTSDAYVKIGAVTIQYTG